MDVSLEPFSTEAPLDVDAFLQALPRAKRLQGFIVAATLDQVCAKDVRIPVATAMRLRFAHCREAFPQLSTREALRRLGGAAHRAVATSPMGRVFFAHASGPAAYFHEMPKGLAIAGSGARARCHKITASCAVFDVENMYGSLELFIGGVEAAVAERGCVARVALARRGHFDGTLRVEWAPA